MERVPVKSANLKSVGYDINEQTLEVEFLDGSIYRHQRVPPLKFQKLLAAPSKAYYLAAYIVGDCKPFEKTESDPPGH